MVLMGNDLYFLELGTLGDFLYFWSYYRPPEGRSLEMEWHLQMASPGPGVTCKDPVSKWVDLWGLKTNS